MHVFANVFLVFAAAYFGALIGLAVVLLKYSRRRALPAPEKSLPTLSVIVAARNEADNLPRLISCLKAQDYPPEKIEFCIIDDRSEDDSRAILQKAKNDFQELRIVEMNDSLPDFAPKKRALAAGVKATTGEILLFTDADCAPPVQWAKTMARHHDEQTAVVLGYSPYFFEKRTNAVLAGLLSLDMFSLGAVAAAGAALGKPMTATGCNFSYKRSAYERAGGFEKIKHWVSGDDDLMLHHLMASRSGECRFALQPESFVPEKGPASFKQFWHQRLRWASKGFAYPPLLTLALIAVYLLNLTIVLLPVWVLSGNWEVAKLAVLAMGIKVAGEFIFLSVAAKIFKQKSLLKFFPLAALFHPAYITIFAAMGTLLQFRWKDEKAPNTMT